VVALPVSHRRASKKKVSLSQLQRETIARGSDAALPGYTQRITQLCRKYSGFLPSLVTIDNVTGLEESLARAANEDAISIKLAFISLLTIRNVIMAPIANAGVTWDLFVIWQAGEVTSALRTLLSELKVKGQLGSPGMGKWSAIGGG